MCAMGLSIVLTMHLTRSTANGRLPPSQKHQPLNLRCKGALLHLLPQNSAPSPPPSQTHSTKPATENHEPQQKEKVVFDQPSGGQSSNVPSTTEMHSPSSMPEPQQVPSVPSIPMALLLKQKQQKADAETLPIPYSQHQINVCCWK